MRLTIHRGTKEIGGSCIEVATARTRIVLDVGMPLVDADRQPFDVRKLRGKTTQQLLKEGILPRVSGLFDNDAAPPDAVLLSHAHVDHVGLLPYSGAKIPVYASKGTSQMMLAGAIFAGRSSLPRERHRRIRAGKLFTVGDVRITPFAVDHSTFDCLAFLIEGEGKRVLYSGDLRLHGRKPGMVRKLLEGTAGKPVDVLLMEGTHFGSEKTRGITERNLEKEIINHVKDAPGLVLACFSPIDLDRLVTFYRAARRTGRTFVVDVYAAFVLHLVHRQVKVPLPEAENGIRVYYNRTFEASWRQRGLDTVHRNFLKDRITLEEIRQEPAEYLMVSRPSMVELDFGRQLPQWCRCLYSYWTGYLEKPDWVQLQERVEAATGEFISAHTSGHIFIADIIKLVKKIDPRTVVPIHTFEPTEFAKHFRNVHRLEDGQALVLN